MYYDLEIRKSLSEARLEQLQKMTYGRRIVKKGNKYKLPRKVFRRKDSCTGQLKGA